MNVLITICHLTRAHGSEIWTLAVAREFKRRGDHVFIYSQKLGPFWATYFAHEFSTLRTAEECSGLRIDLAIIQHANELQHRDFFCRNILPIIADSETVAVTHGTYADPEKPVSPDWLSNCSRVCISQEIAWHYNETDQYFIDKYDWSILKQPVDPEWFEIPESNKFETVCWASHRWPIPESLAETCRKMDKELIVVGNLRVVPEEVREVYGKSDLIIGTGRWIYEGMAAGRPCVVADSNYTLGYVNEATVRTFERFNMTTRHLGRISNDEISWYQILRRYNEYYGNWGRIYAKENYASQVIVDELLAIIKDNKDNRVERNKRIEELRSFGEKCKKESDEFWGRNGK